MTTAVSQQPSAHTQRYDRQLRLWASSGQAKLERRNVLVVGASALSAQILKNLVLPGISSFTILDDAIVQPADLGVNFFLQPGESEGKSAAQEMARLLVEMNDSVKANVVVESPSSFFKLNPEWFTQFLLVISVNQSQSFDLALSDLIWSLVPEAPTIPFLRVRSAGMVGEIHISQKELTIVETHPDSVVDLRLTRPFPELEALADEYDLETEDTMLHSHIPFVVILLKKLQEWKAKNGGKLPTTADRAEFVALVNAARRADNADEENFDEAIGALGKHVWRPIASDGAGGGGVPSEVSAMFQDPECEHITPSSTEFWMLVRALREFVAASPTRSLPLTGSLPDMKATSAIYLRLQNVYRSKAASDLKEFVNCLENVATQTGFRHSIKEEVVQAFVKHAGYLKLVRGRSERQKVYSPNQEAARMAFMDPVNPFTFQHHLALEASDQFFEANGRYPGSSISFSQSITSSRGKTNGVASTSLAPESHLGSVSHSDRAGDEPRQAKRHKSETPSGENDGDADVRMADAATSASASMHTAEEDQEPDLEKDKEMLGLLAREVALKHGITATDEPDKWEKVEQAVGELVRSGHASLPATNALLGGVAAQEAIKMVMEQYVPADNTIVYDGIQQAIGVFRL